MLRRTKDGSSRFCRNSSKFDGLVGQVGVIKPLCRHCHPVIVLYGISFLETLEGAFSSYRRTVNRQRVTDLSFDLQRCSFLRTVTANGFWPPLRANSRSPLQKESHNRLTLSSRNDPVRDLALRNRWTLKNKNPLIAVKTTLSVNGLSFSVYFFSPA